MPAPKKQANITAPAPELPEQETVVKQESDIQRLRREAQERENFERLPAGKPRMKLTVQNLPKGFEYYYAQPKQFEELLSAGYVFVKKDQNNEVSIGSLRERPKSLGNIVSREGGTDPNDRHYLMAIPKEWYNENQQKKAQDVLKVERQIRKGTFRAPEKAYLPDNKENKIESN